MANNLLFIRFYIDLQGFRILTKKLIEEGMFDEEEIANEDGVVIEN